MLGIIPRPTHHSCKVFSMSQENSPAKGLSDGWADAIAATAVIAIVISTVVYWLSGFPS